MYLIADGLTRLMAPILSFTADELWRYLPGAREESVHLAVFPTGPELEAMADRELLDRWKRLTDLREQVLAEIEPLRKDKRIGSSLQAKVVLSVATDEMAFLKQYAHELPALFIVSDVELREAAPGAAAGGRPSSAPAASSASGAGVTSPACPIDPASAGLCDRCQEALAVHRPCLKSSRFRSLLRRAVWKSGCRSPSSYSIRSPRRWYGRWCRSDASVEVVPGFMNLTHVRNTGAAFGFLNAADFPLKTVFIPAVALAAVVWVAVYCGRPRRVISCSPASGSPSSWAAPPATCWIG